MDIPHGNLWFGFIGRFDEVGHYDVSVDFQAELSSILCPRENLLDGTYANGGKECPDKSGPISDPSPLVCLLPLA